MQPAGTFTMAVPYHFPGVLISAHWRAPLWPGLSPPLSHPLQQPRPGGPPGCLMGSVPGHHSKRHPLRQWFSPGVILHPTAPPSPGLPGALGSVWRHFCLSRLEGWWRQDPHQCVAAGEGAVHRSAHRMLPAMKTDQLQNVHRALTARGPALRKHLFPSASENAGN